MMFRYKVKFYTDDPSMYENIEDKVYAIEKGLVAANSYGEAVNIIVNYHVGNDTDDMVYVEISECENPIADPELSDMI